MSHAIFGIFLYSKKSLPIWSLNLLGVLCFILWLCISDFQSHAEFNVKSLKQPCGIWCLYLSDLITHHSLAASLPRPLAVCAPQTHQVPAPGPLHIFPLSGTFPKCHVFSKASLVILSKLLPPACCHSLSFFPALLLFIFSRELIILWQTFSLLVYLLIINLAPHSWLGCKLHKNRRLVCVQCCNLRPRLGLPE